MRPRITGIILAAGSSSRMGSRNKLTTMWQGKPLVRHVADATLASDLDEVVVVTGHEADAVLAVLPADIQHVHNGNYADGMSTSLRAGVLAAGGADGVLVLLGDMPLITSAHVNQMLDIYGSVAKGSIVIATAEGQPGNPVLFPAQYSRELERCTGDRGAKSIIESHKDRISRVEIGDAARRDFDTRSAFDG